MQFGIFTIGDVTPDPTNGKAPSEAQRIRSMTKYALKADQLDHADKLGVVAQEVAEVFPGLVDEGRGIDGPELTVKSSVFTFMLIKAVQELTARVNHLESQLALG